MKKNNGRTKMNHVTYFMRFFYIKGLDKFNLEEERSI